MSGSPFVQPQPRCSVTRECESVSWECTRARHRGDGEEGGAATKDGAEQSAGEQNRGKGLRTYTPISIQAHLDNNSDMLTLTFLTQARKESNINPVRPFSTIRPRVLFHPWQRPSSTFSLDSLGICLLQYDVSRRMRPQLSRKPVS